MRAHATTARSAIIKLSHPHDLTISGFVIPCYIRLEEVIIVEGDQRSVHWELIFETPRGRILLEEAHSEEAATALYLGYTESPELLPNTVPPIEDQPPLSSAVVNGRGGQKPQKGGD